MSYKKDFEEICKEAEVDSALFKFCYSKKERNKGDVEGPRFEAKADYTKPFQWVVLYVSDYDFYLVWKRSEFILSNYTVSKKAVMENLQLKNVNKGIEFAWRDQETVRIFEADGLKNWLLQNMK